MDRLVEEIESLDEGGMELVDLVRYLGYFYYYWYVFLYLECDSEPYSVLRPKFGGSGLP